MTDYDLLRDVARCEGILRVTDVDGEDVDVQWCRMRYTCRRFLATRSGSRVTYVLPETKDPRVCEDQIEALEKGGD